MTAQLVNCELISPSSPAAAAAAAANSNKVAKLGQMDRELPIFSVMERRQEVERDSAGKATDAESGISAGEGELCVQHEVELDWFCGTEQKLICCHCAIVGDCRDHSVTPLVERVTAVRNRLVDVCEKIQLQAQRIEKFIDQTLSVKELKLQSQCAKTHGWRNQPSVMSQRARIQPDCDPTTQEFIPLTAASRAREQVVAQVTAAREALEEEEQRLLEEVQREEERVEQCLLTQRVHWKQALDNLSHTRSSLVHMLTDTPDTQLATSAQEIADRVEESEGVGEPCDTDKLQMKAECGDSKLLRGLWATALLLGPNAFGSPNLMFDERTVSPLLSLSDDFRTLTFLHKKPRQSQQYDTVRFDSWPNALGSLLMSSGTHSWVVDVGQSAAFKVGACYATMERKGSGNGARLGYNSQSWVLSHYDGDYSFIYGGKSVPLQVVKRPQRIGLLLDWPSQTLMFYEPDSSAVLYSVTHLFSGPLLAACAVTDQSVTILH